MIKLRRALTWVSDTYFTEIPVTERRHAEEHFVRRLVAIQSRGKQEAASYFKKNRLALTRYMVGRPLKIEGVDQTSDLLPRVIPGGIRTGVRRLQPLYLRYTLTLFSISRSILGGTPVDLNAIEQPSSAQLDITDAEIDWFNKHLDPTISWKPTGSFHWTVKSGPMGPALQYSLIDLMLLLKEHTDLFLTLCNHYSRDVLTQVHSLISMDEDRHTIMNRLLKIKNKPMRLRKLAVKPDREAKSRVFAILDYWSQSALKGLHEELFQLLRKLPTDCTFDQGRHLAKMAAKLGQTTFYSFDLTNATDRFPIALQRRLLSSWIGEEKAKEWEEIMVSLPFSFKGKSVYYKAGQPMGAYSSWAMFSLSHHLVVQIASRRTGNYRFFMDYCLLGDDIVIFDSRVAEEYASIIKSLGVEISESKTHQSERAFEFAKRWFFLGEEISPYPVVGLTEVVKNWSLVPEFLNTQCPMKGYRKTWTFGSPVWTALSQLLSPYERMQKHLIKKVQIVSLMPNFWIHNAEEDRKLQYQQLLALIGMDAEAFDYQMFGQWLATKAKPLLIKQASEQSQRFLSASMRYRNAYYDIENSDGVTSPNPAPSTFEEIRLHPLVSTLRGMALEMQSMSPALNIDEEWETFWTSWRNIKISTIPRLNGIIPLRARDRMSKSQSYLGLDLLRTLSSTFHGTDWEDDLISHSQVEEEVSFPFV